MQKIQRKHGRNWKRARFELDLSSIVRLKSYLTRSEIHLRRKRRRVDGADAGERLIEGRVLHHGQERPEDLLLEDRRAKRRLVHDGQRHLQSVCPRTVI